MASKETREMIRTLTFCPADFTKIRTNAVRGCDLSIESCINFPEPISDSHENKYTLVKVITHHYRKGGFIIFLCDSEKDIICHGRYDEEISKREGI